MACHMIIYIIGISQMTAALKSKIIFIFINIDKKPRKDEANAALLLNAGGHRLLMKLSVLVRMPPINLHTCHSLSATWK